MDQYGVCRGTSLGSQSALGAVSAVIRSLLYGVIGPYNKSPKIQLIDSKERLNRQG
jgi:hypothetical protein